ncbi:hypothetical protein B9T24_15245 [Acinetobacter sp. ANC 4654]|uniref:hypothetical protein n=1 Tax=Acinetobacter sp. ANC 4654 TaxID=1977872 RepID=UPI000A3543D1|nr:hypothetical protein [Acinetobacter sp. ANC 4654]OTG92720.1 hypothetical protein B9T24_15245 [Acinetobacter sp. ANC 4654]
MRKLNLNLVENAVDSFNEALEKYDLGTENNSKPYKFAVLHMAHFLELVLKQAVLVINSNLVYTSAFKEMEKRANNKKISLYEMSEQMKVANYSYDPEVGKSNHTISVNDAKKFLITLPESFNLNTEFLDDINLLKILRNNIEHFEFELSLKDTRLVIGRLVRSAKKFTVDFKLFDLDQHISASNIEVYNLLMDEYEHKLKAARETVTEETEDAYRGYRPKEWHWVEWNVLDCLYCCESDVMIRDNTSSTGYKCQNCGEIDSDEIPVTCERCSITFEKFYTRSYKDEYNMVNYICDNCHFDCLED